MATKAGDATGDAPEGGPGASAAEHADIAGMSYEQARDELVEIVARLEGGQVALQESMDLWLRAEVLPHTIVATKHDKVKASKRQKRKKDLAEACRLEPGDVIWVSAANGTGIDRLRGLVLEWLR